VKQILKATVIEVGNTVRFQTSTPNGVRSPLAFEGYAFSVDQKKELGALYSEPDAVTITIEAGEDNAAYLPEIETRLRASAAAFGPDKYEAAWLTRAADSVRRVWEGPPTTPIDEVAALPILAPPLVDGRPSCCVSASRHDVSLTTMGAGWVIHARNVIEARFCPFCGAKLPEVTP
jgi:hypothetical protein